MNMERLDGENSGEDMGQDKTAQSILFRPRRAIPCLPLRW